MKSIFQIKCTCLTVGQQKVCNSISILLKNTVLISFETFSYHLIFKLYRALFSARASTKSEYVVTNCDFVALGERKALEKRSAMNEIKSLDLSSLIFSNETMMAVENS